MTAPGTATEIEVTQRLTHGQPAARLPKATIDIDRHWRQAHIRLGPDADRTDLHTWAIWLNRGGAYRFQTDDRESQAMPGHWTRDTFATAEWRGWTFTAHLVTCIPAPAGHDAAEVA